MPTACFLVEPTDTVRWGLRRYSSSVRPSPCPSMPGEWGYHNAFVTQGEEAAVLDAAGSVLNGGRGVPPVDDPRWPTQCACGYAFRPDDETQKWVELLYRCADGPDVAFTLREAAPGAMWDAYWMPRKGPDGRSLCVRLPDGCEWWVDGPAGNGPGWERSGEVPLITARPSIASAGYHGWLTDGVLSDPV